jgi:hypothetical protein
MSARHIFIGIGKELLPRMAWAPRRGRPKASRESKRRRGRVAVVVTKIMTTAAIELMPAIIANAMINVIAPTHWIT